LLTDDHVFTAHSYGWLASNVNAQSKYAQAQPLFEKALEIYRRLLTDDHPYTATGVWRHPCSSHAPSLAALEGGRLRFADSADSVWKVGVSDSSPIRRFG
jgi:hypothetical protein